MADEHVASQWQVTLDTDPTFSTPTYDSGVVGDLLEHQVATPLAFLTDYLWRVQFTGSATGVTDWSESTAFKTAAEVFNLITGHGDNLVTGDGDPLVVLGV